MRNRFTTQSFTGTFTIMSLDSSGDTFDASTVTSTSTSLNSVYSIAQTGSIVSASSSNSTVSQSTDLTI